MSQKLLLCLSEMHTVVSMLTSRPWPILSPNIPFLTTRDDTLRDSPHNLIQPNIFLTKQKNTATPRIQVSLLF